MLEPVTSEPAPIRRIDAAGLLRPLPEPTPVEGATLAPRDALFADDALIFDAIGSSRVAFGVPGRTRLTVAFPDTPVLGIWTKPGAPFLCIEPWHGLADADKFEGELKDKELAVELEPGEYFEAALVIEVK